MIRTRNRGFTAVEVLITTAIALVLAALAVNAFGRQTPRKRLDSTALELRALLFGARQQALTSGRTVVVMLFPDYAPGGWNDGVGRVIVYEDGAGTFFSDAAPVHFGDYAPATPAADADSEVLEVVDLPRSVRVGSWGVVNVPGDDARPLRPAEFVIAMPAPLSGIDVKACDFCASGRGAIAFDSNGRATFHSGDGPPLARPVGSSFALGPELSAGEHANDTLDEWRALVVVARTGAVRTLSHEL